MKQRHGIHKLVFFTCVALVCGIYLLSNVLVSALTSWKSLRFDMTDSQLYQLSEATEDVLTDLETPVSITVFSDRDNFFVVAVELLDRFCALNDQLTVRYSDPYTQPLVLENYRKAGLNAGENDVVVEADGRTRLLTLEDLYTTDEQGQVETIRAEQALVSAIYGVTSGETGTVLFTNGHNEQTGNTLASLFEQNNFEVVNASVDATGIDPETDIVVIASPQRDLTDRETQLIGDYLKNGGKVMAFVPASTEPFTNLNTLLREWGLSLDPDCVFDDQLFVDANHSSIIGMYAQHTITQYFSENQIFPVLPKCRTLTLTGSAASGVSVKSLLLSSPYSYAKSAEYLGDAARAEGDPEGPFCVAATAEKDDGVLLVVGSGQIYADDLLSVSSYANRDFLLQCIGYCSDQETVLNIAPKYLAPPPISVYPDDLRTFAILFGVITVIILAAGCVVSIRRKLL